MNSKASKLKRHRRPTSAELAPKSIWWLVAIAATAISWLVVATAAASRTHFVMGYNVLSTGPPQLEPFLASYFAWGFATLVMAVWCGLATLVLRGNRTTTPWPIAALVLAWLPLLMASTLRLYGAELPPSYWEPLWLAAWSGVSFGWLVQECAALPVSSFPTWISRVCARGAGSPAGRSASQQRQGAGDFGQKPQGGAGRCGPISRRWDIWAIATAAGCAAIGWTWQSDNFYNNFLLGFNDFGHFAQRVANTASGRGLLLETPVLPPFWDHFNPGLLLLVPLWMLFPSPYLFFVLQSVALSSGAVLVWAIARQRSLGPWPSLLFGLAWLAQPVLGQMNVAYTYGWHPISLAIPLLLAAIWLLTAHRPWFALATTIVAMSMEEGVIVIVCLFCAVAALTSWYERRSKARYAADDSNPFGVSPGVWLLIAGASGATFVLVYRFSGLAEFQTARFASLGSGTVDVLLSPLLRPSAFWGNLFRWQNLYFLLSLWIPCFVPCLWRGWRPMLATALPLLVLLVWDHRPASSLAFQYTSTLLPLFWLATILGTQAYAVQTSGAQAEDAPPSDDPSTVRCQRSRAIGAAGGALSTSLILSLFVGQLPYSSPTLLDVMAVSYGVTDAPHQRRLASEIDGQWLTQQVLQIRQDGAAVLATGRVAAHLVGNTDVETVGQYLIRRPQLAELADRLNQPIGHYRWIILDRREGFQQSPAETAMVEAEAVLAGFRVTADEFDVVVMEKVPHAAVGSVD